MAVDVKQMAQYCLPAASVGVAAGLLAGGLAAFAGQPAGWAVLTGLGLGVPLILFGSGYSVLVALGKVPAGVFTPAAFYWLIAFPLSLLVHAIVTEWVFTGRPGLPPDPWQFLAFRALLSMGFAIGFLWMHEQVARFWWPRILDTNQYARRTVGHYSQLATALEARKADRDRSRKSRVA